MTLYILSELDRHNIYCAEWITAIWFELYMAYTNIH